MRRRVTREESERNLVDGACNEILKKSFSKQTLWCIGIALYWAEGAKQKPHNVSQKVAFSNSDPAMIKLFVRWLHECCYIKTGLVYELVY